MRKVNGVILNDALLIPRFQSLTLSKLAEESSSPFSGTNP